MAFLSLDTSSATTSLALVEGERVLEHVVFRPPRRQSQLLPGSIAELLKRHHLDLASLEALVVGLGPGSFTGLRVGIATMKGLAYAAERPLIGVSSLAALAMHGPADVPLFTCAVVKKGELYLGRYRRNAQGVEALAPETSMTVAGVAEALSAEPLARAMGPALAQYRAELIEGGAAPQQLLDVPEFPSAVALAALATVPAGFRKEDVFRLEPHYLRGSGAEENPKFPPLAGVTAQARMRDE